MDDTQKMLQAIIHGQNALKQELGSKIDKLGKKLDGLENRIDGVEERIDRVEKNLTKRIDRIGKQLSYLEDDAPTREEFENLASRVNKLEHSKHSAL